MKVLVDCLSAGIGGGLTYATSQLSELSKVGDLDLTVLANKISAPKIAAAAPGLSVRTIYGSNTAARQAVWQMSPVWYNKIDVFYGIGNFAPLYLKHRPTVVTLQNPNYFGSARHTSTMHSLGQRSRVRMCWLSVKRATRCIAISYSLATAVQRELDLPQGYLKVVQSGASSFDGIASSRPIGLVTNKRYVLVLANDYAHKRIDASVRSFSAMISRCPEEDLAIVIAGHLDRPRQLWLRSLMAQPALLHSVGSVDRAEARWLLENAGCLLSNSATEAFPLTPSEAQSVGCRPVLSDIGAHREVSGPGAQFFPIGGRDESDAAAVCLRRALEAGKQESWTWPVSWRENSNRIACILRSAVDGD